MSLKNVMTECLYIPNAIKNNLLDKCSVLLVLLLYYCVALLLL